MKISLNLNTYQNYKPLTFKGALRQNLHVDTFKLKEKSKQDYEQEVERRKQGDKRILFVDSKGERLKPPHQIQHAETLDFYDDDFIAYDDFNFEDDDFGSLIGKGTIQIKAFGDDFQERLNEFRQSKYYNIELENKEAVEQLSNLSPDVIESLSDDFLCKILQFNYADCNLFPNFEEFLVEEFTVDELYIITSNPTLTSMLVLCMTNAFDNEKFDEVIEFLHNQTQL